MIWFLAVIGRLTTVLIGSWLAVLAPVAVALMLLPESWQYYLISPMTVGLLCLTLLALPVAVCTIRWRWMLELPKERVFTPREWLEQR